MRNGLVSEEVIVDRVKKAVIQALGVEEDLVTLDASLIEDLGAESLDFLDIAFRLERVFDLQFPRDSLMERLGTRYESELFARDGVLTDAALELFKEMMPEVDKSKIKRGIREEEVMTLFTVQTWVRTVQTILATVPEVCANCGGKTTAKEAEFFEYACNKCGEKVLVASGGDIFFGQLERALSLPHIQEVIQEEMKALEKIRAQRPEAETELHKEVPISLPRPPRL